MHALLGKQKRLPQRIKKLYALRDATATVGSLPLIVSSILSKKLAGGAKSFLFDVKVGEGALLESLEAAHKLAQALVEGAVANGHPATAVLSDMNVPLGKAIGNALEVTEAIHMLSQDQPDSHKDNRLREVCLTLTSEALRLCGLVTSSKAGYEQAEALLKSGAGREKLREIIRAQGGDERVVDTPETLLPSAPVQLPFIAQKSGFVFRIAAHSIGKIVVGLGGGRANKEDSINPSVGIVLNKSVGDRVTKGDVLAIIHAGSTQEAQTALALLRPALTIAQTAIIPSRVVLDILRNK